MSSPPPIPVQPLHYIPPTHTRPSLLSAISALSIILGSLSILANGAAIFIGILITLASSATSNFNRSFQFPHPAVAAIQPNTPDSNTDDASPLSDRQVIISSLTSLHPLSPLRQKQLDSLLQLAGRKILPLTGNDLTPQSISANITDSGHFPAGTGHSNAGADYFVLARGRIDINDEHATFNPSDSSETLRASATESPAPPITPTPPTIPSQLATPASLTPADITLIISTLQSRTNQTLTTPQIAKLRTELSSPTQTLFNSTSALPAQITTASLTNGTLSFSTTTGFFTLHSNGNFSTFSGFTSSPFANTSTQSTLVILSSVVSLALAVLLLIAGLLTLRDSPRSRRLHLIYACLKLPFLLISMASWSWLWYAITHHLTTGLQTNTPFLSLSLMFSIPSLISLLYPIALLIIFNTQSIKNYYPSPS